MTQITGGFIEYSEQLQPGTFGSPQAKAHFDFGVTEGESYEATAQLAAQQAKNYVRTILGLKKAEAPAAIATLATAQPAPTTEHRLETAVGSAGASVLNDKEKLAQAAGLLAAPPAPKKARKAATPALVAEIAAATGQAISAGTPGDDPSPIDELDEILGGSPEPVQNFTDQELTQAVQAKNRVLKDAQKIYDLRTAYTGEPKKTVREIPKEKRAQFLKDLAALT